MRRILRPVMVSCGLWLVGCTSVSPWQALTSTIPLSTDSERLTYIGDVSGKACNSTLLFVIALEGDSSIYKAKQAALRDANNRYQRQAVALVDVTIDIESTSYVVYERTCTLLRGKALGSEIRTAAPSSVDPTAPDLVSSNETSVPEQPGEQHADPAIQLPYLAEKKPAVLQCLELDRVAGPVTVKISVAATGVPRTLTFVEMLAPTTKVCIRDVLKNAAYPQAAESYDLTYTFARSSRR